MDGRIQTFSGRMLDVFDPNPDDLTIEDIAHALAHTCRYSGHCLTFYSVAEHSILVSRMASPKNRLSALMHDASEAYLTDIPRPFKHKLVGYKELEHSLMKAIARKFEFDYPLPAEVTTLDRAIVRDERIQNMRSVDLSPRDWGDTIPGLGVELNYWKPDLAEGIFLGLFQSYRT